MKSVILIVLDGYGISPPGPGNSITLANPSNINSYLYTYPNTTLKASSEAVGLPTGEVGNTEVGHLNLGAGRVVFQDLPRINMAIADGSFFKNPVLLKALDHLKKTNGNWHFIGLVSDGTVHSSIEHLQALLNFSKINNFNRVYIHAITDGRDSPPKSSQMFISSLKEKISEYGIGKIASVMGRYYAMDRDHRWERTEKAYLCLTQGIGNKAESIEEAIKTSYAQERTDEFIVPTNITENGQPLALIKPGDAVLFFNYRIDRPRQLTKAFVLDNFEKDANKTQSFDPYATRYYKTNIPQQKPTDLNPPFKRENKIKNLMFITMTEYEKNLPVDVAFPPVVVRMPLGRVLSEHGIPQLRMSESEKERFVTFYFNGLKETAFPSEERLIVPSPKVPTYDQKPEMSALEMTEILLKKMKAMKHKFILINFANPDMVGHTGNLKACIRAVQVVDECMGKIVQTALNLDYTIFITADHGNAEQKIDPKTGEIATEHTGNQVPFIAIGKELQGRFARLPSGILADVAPTILAVMDIPQPSDMTGRNLLEDILSV